MTRPLDNERKALADELKAVHDDLLARGLGGSAAIISDAIDYLRTPIGMAEREGAVTVSILGIGDNENTPAEAVHHALAKAHKEGLIESWSDPLPAPTVRDVT